MNALQLGRATFVMIAVIFTAIVMVIAFLFHQENLPTWLQTWLETNPWEWMFSGIGVIILGGLYRIWKSSPSTLPAAIVKDSESRKGGILAKDATGHGATVENSEAESHIIAINQLSNTPPKA